MAVRPWPESFPGEPDTNIAHRTLDLLSLLVRVFSDEVTGRFLTRRLPRLQTWLNTRREQV